MSRGRSRAALRRAKRGYRPGQTRSSLFRRLRRKFRDLRKKYKAREADRMQSIEDNLLDAIDEGREKYGSADSTSSASES